MTDIIYENNKWLMCTGLQVNMLVADNAIDINKIFSIENGQFINVNKDNINIYISYWVKTIKSGVLDLSEVSLLGDEINLNANKELNISIDNAELKFTKNELEKLQNIINYSDDYICSKGEKGETGEKGATGRPGPCGRDGKNNFYVMFINDYNKDLFSRLVKNIKQEDPSSIFLFKDRISKQFLKNLNFNKGKVNIEDLVN